MPPDPCALLTDALYAYMQLCLDSWAWSAYTAVFQVICRLVLDFPLAAVWLILFLAGPLCPREPRGLGFSSIQVAGLRAHLHKASRGATLRAPEQLAIELSDLPLEGAQHDRKCDMWKPI